MYNYIEKFEEMLSEFDFKKVKNVMEYLNWEWHGTGVPNIYEMKKTCWELFKNVLARYLSDDPITSSISSGGFEVSISKESISLKFVLTDFYSEYV